MSVYATLNPDDKSANMALSGDDLIARPTATAYVGVRATIAITAEKWYWEITNTANGGAAYTILGIATADANLGLHVGLDEYGWSHSNHGYKYHSGVFAAYGSTWGLGDVIGIALDMDNGELYFSENGVWIGDPVNRTDYCYNGLSGTLYPMISLYNANCEITANFGASAFTTAAPAGYNSGLYGADAGGSGYGRWQEANRWTHSSRWVSPTIWLASNQWLG